MAMFVLINTGNGITQ